MTESHYVNPWLPPEALGLLRETTARTILDVGGGVAPHYRATHVVDSLEYNAERLSDNSWGGVRTDPWLRANYAQLSLCDDLRWPFDDQSIDLGLCSHTLEDLPEPRFLLREMARICRKVMIISPARLIEHTLHIARPCYAGFRHHTWMVEAVGDCLILTKKSSVQLKRGCHLTCPLGKTLSVADGAMWYYGAPPRVQIQAFATLADEIRENRAFVARIRQGGLTFVESGQALTLREKSWLLRARLLARWPNGIGRNYVVPESTVVVTRGNLLSGPSRR